MFLLSILFCILCFIGGFILGVFANQQFINTFYNLVIKTDDDIMGDL